MASYFYNLYGVAQWTNKVKLFEHLNISLYPAKLDGYFINLIMSSWFFNCGSVPEKTDPYLSVPTELLIMLLKYNSGKLHWDIQWDRKVARECHVQLHSQRNILSSLRQMEKTKQKSPKSLEILVLSVSFIPCSFLKSQIKFTHFMASKDWSLRCYTWKL